MGKYKISGVPICENGKLVGILTNRDLRFLEDYGIKIKEVMTKDHLVTAPVGTTLDDARQILRKHKIEKLPIVDGEGYLRGLITIKDIEKAVQYPNSARDRGGRLLAGAAVGITHDYMDRVDELIKASVDVLVLDSAHGQQTNIFTCLKAIKQKSVSYTHLDVYKRQGSRRSGRSARAPARRRRRCCWATSPRTGCRAAR